jgi:hypothetical protein
MDAVKLFALAVIVILVASLTLTVLGLMTWRLFWMIAIAAAIIAYYALPKMRPRA